MSPKTPPPKRVQSNQLEDFHSILRVSNKDELRSAVKREVEALGFSDFLFASWAPSPTTPGELRYTPITTFSTAWIDKYYREKFFLDDPALLHCQKSWTPLPWTSSLFSAPKTLSIYEEARLYGISAGCAIPIAPERCGFSFVRDQEADAGLPDVLRVLPAMSLLTGFLMEAVKSLGGTDAESPHQRLTPRETECLKLMADGLRDAEIARRLHITLRTVVAHISSAKIKLDAANRGQLIARAMSRQIV